MSVVREDGGGKGILTSAKEYTYIDLSVLVQNNNLVPGQEYILSDFRTIHFIPLTNTLNINSAQYNSGVEKLLLKALTTNTFKREATSLSYLYDTIYYNFNLTSETSTSATPISINTIPGKIIYRKGFSTTGGVITSSYDWRACLCRSYRISEAVNESASWTGIKYQVNSSVAVPALTEAYRFFSKLDSNTLANPTLTLTDGFNSYTKNLLKPNRTAYAVSEIPQNTYAYIIYETATDSFLLQDVTFWINVLKNSDRWSWSPTTFSIGNGLSFTVDSNDFIDEYTFHDKNGGSFSDYTLAPTLNTLNDVVVNNVVVRGTSINSFNVTWGVGFINSRFFGGGTGFRNMVFDGFTSNHIHTAALRDGVIDTDAYNLLTVATVSFTAINTPGSCNTTVFASGNFFLGFNLMRDCTFILSTGGVVPGVSGYSGSMDSVRNCFFADAKISGVKMIGNMRNKTSLGGRKSVVNCIFIGYNATTEVVDYDGNEVEIYI